MSFSRWIRFHKRRRELVSWLEDIATRHEQAARDLREAPEELEHLHNELHFENELAEGELAQLISNHTVERARRSLIPVPEFRLDGPDWCERRDHPGTFHLTAEALSDLRSQIRKESKERFETYLLWATAITGVLGALTGLVAVLRN